MLVVELPSSESKALYDEKTFQEFQRHVVVQVEQSSEADDSPSTDTDNMGTFDDPRPLLQATLQNTGFQINLSPDQVKGRFFAVVDGNHRLKALTSNEVKSSPNAVEQVRCGIVRMEKIIDLINAGTLVNHIRGIQAEDNFYDRVLWVRYHIKGATCICLFCT